MLIPDRNLARINNCLLAIIIIINLYVVAAPFIPRILFDVQKRGGTAAKLTNELAAKPEVSSKAKQLVVPAMLLDQPIHEGRNVYAELDKGVWRWPGGSSPDKGGNTVLVGHRFSYTQPKGVFYFLDKVRTGDKIGVEWDGKRYIYQVSTVRTVKPSQVEILDPTARPTLTLYTCAPLWLPKDRLVVTAQLKEVL